MQVALGLGSNLGDREEELHLVRKWLAGIDPGVRFSSEYETEPVGCAAGTPPFRNQVAQIVWRGNLETLLNLTQEYERRRGRRTVRGRNEPRSLDLDLLWAGDRVRKTARMEIPHPRMVQRNFVLQPLAEICPEARIPGFPGTVKEAALWNRDKGEGLCQRID